jgi:hypothetical protein
MAPTQSGSRGCWEWRQGDRNVRQVEVAAIIIQGSSGHGLEHDAGRLQIAVLRLSRLNAEEAELDSRSPVPDSELDPAAADLVEHRDLLERAQGMVSRASPADQGEAWSCAVPWRETDWVRKQFHAACHGVRRHDKRESLPPHRPPQAEAFLVLSCQTEPGVIHVIKQAELQTLHHTYRISIIARASQPHRSNRSYGSLQSDCAIRPIRWEMITTVATSKPPQWMMPLSVITRS